MSDTEESPSTAHRNTRLTFNIGGQRHETFLSTLRAIPGTRLSWIADNYHLLRQSPVYDPVKDEYFFDRNPTCFEAIVNYFRTGQLHYPNNVCGPVFECELKFWGVEEEQMQTCCWEGYTANRDKDAKLKGFKGPDLQDSECENNECNSKSHRYRMKVWKFIDDAYSSTPARMYSYLCYILLFVYILLPMMSSMSIIKDGGSTNMFIISVAEIVLNIYFTLELLLRFILSPHKKEFVKQSVNVADFMSLLPNYLELVTDSEQVINYVGILAVFRIVKVFRSFRYNYTLQVLANTLQESLPELLLLAFLMVILATVFAFASYFVEGKLNNTHFRSIPHCLWWALITMTTVGYGDMYPRSWVGKVIGVMCAICGLLMVALPVSVVATNFSIYYSYAKAQISLPPKRKVIVAADANCFLGEDAVSEAQKKSTKHKLSPTKNKVYPTNVETNDNTSHVNDVKSRWIRLSQSAKVQNVVSEISRKSIISQKQKIDFATLVMALSSKGVWKQAQLVE